MTTVEGVCASCGAVAPAGEFLVYLPAPGILARCRTCRSVLMVLVTIRGLTCVDLRGLAVFEQP